MDLRTEGGPMVRPQFISIFYVNTTAVNKLIPEQKEGKKVDLSHVRAFESREYAVACFKRAYERLMAPRVWHQLSGAMSAEFFLIDETGVEPHRPVLKDDYLKINIPGPGTIAGKGYDWVFIEQIEDKANPEAKEESIGMKLKPCGDPGNKDMTTAHFFTEEASSTFIISRNGNTVSSCYYGRNEVPNVHTESITDNIRNTVVGSGAWASFSEMQWHSLIKGFLEEESV